MTDITELAQSRIAVRVYLLPYRAITEHSRRATSNPHVANGRPGH